MTIESEIFRLSLPPWHFYSLSTQFWISKILMIYLEPFYWYLVLKASNFLDFFDGVEVDDIFGCATKNLQWLFSLKKFTISHWTLRFCTSYPYYIAFKMIISLPNFLAALSIFFSRCPSTLFVSKDQHEIFPVWIFKLGKHRWLFLLILLMNILVQLNQNLGYFCCIRICYKCRYLICID